MPNYTMQPEDRIRLQHMLEAAQDAREFVKDRKREELDTDRMLMLALLKCIEIIGEAANKISDECQSNLPQIAWPQIIAMRNRLIHTYYNVNPNIVWNTVTQELPGLITRLEEALDE